MGKITKTIIEKVPCPDIDLLKNYERYRKLNNLARTPFFLKNRDNTADYLIETKDGEVPVRIFYPTSQRKPKKLIIFFHGGGWVLGNIDTYTKATMNLSDFTDSIVISVDYRLAPENKFPIGFNDCYNITDIIIKYSRKFNVSRRKVYLMGDSAGGNIAASISLRRRDEKKFIPKRQILLYPATAAIRNKELFESVKLYEKNISLSLKQLTDYTELYKSCEEDLNNPYFAPLNATNYKKQPKTLIFVSELDILRDEGIEYANRLQNAKNKVALYEMEEEGHGYYNSIISQKATKKTIKIINEFIS